MEIDKASCIHVPQLLIPRVNTSTYHVNRFETNKMERNNTLDKY